MNANTSHRMISISILFLLLYPAGTTSAQVFPTAVVVDERLAALRDAPLLSGKLLRRLSRGRKVAILAERRGSDGVIFYRVAVTRRTRGWIQREALVSKSRRGDDLRLFRLIEASRGFDRVVRARIFLDYFPRSPLRPPVLLLFGDAAEEAARKLSEDATRRLKAGEMGNGLEFSYFLNYSGLDRYNRQGIRFVFDREAKRFHYDGAVWREILRRFPSSSEAGEARKRLELRKSE